MTAINYPGAEERLKAHEGGDYTDGVHPYDPGGPTRWGITIIDARQYWKPSATANDVRTMPWSVAQAIYKPKYWDRQRCDDLPAGIDDCVFDYGVNSGYARSGKVLRRVLGLPDSDWHTTDEVIAALAKRDPNEIIDAICNERMRFLRSLKIWPTYAHGFTTRVAEVRAYAHELSHHVASGAPPESAPKPNFTPIPSDQMGKGIAPTPAPSTPVIVASGTAAGGAVAAHHHAFDWISNLPTPEHPMLIAIDLVLAMIVVYALIDAAQSYYAATGTVWQRLLATGKQSATILWTRFTVLVTGLAGGIAWVAGLLNAPGVGTAIQSAMKPQYVALVTVGIAVVTEIARRRTLPPAA